ncbi:hypothetical protein [Acinetobacter haemolyticus]|uniref:Uncharacterized protein n=1 Tax=Acinetobacter haemolyticus TaxID=29430 RepID=A0A1L6KPT9_ACIHA|nr:hypothetical protein [Acinetobacter haemolyticus]APR71088.1 hypothetical protein AHTJS_12440 [Acinetobacter haemolyticus]MCU4378702.1 hypothetical protein [Acinetobacter haemolyticus]QHI10915.1 hypothetical protein AhaeAN59_12940 [Acinetobacter haemolyticus]QHI14187.1 hypothetical protein AhaeAN43_12860 [Acinetobacter haemolyticus]QHI23765.1 hypothetical protein Ahae5227_13315 [Acinetobacter haemolyticus]
MPITKMSLPHRPKWQSSAFIIWGPFIGTLIIVITFHSPIMFGDPIRFLKGLITPSVIFPMIGGLFLITPFGYLLGIFPAIITQLLFQHFFAQKLAQTSLMRSIIYSGFLGFMLAPFTLILAILTPSPLIIFSYLQFVLILPTTLICTVIEWKKVKTIGK